MDPTKLVVIDYANQEDLSEILALLDELKLPQDGVAEHLASALVARQGDGGLAGCAAVELYGITGLLRSVAVRPELQGLGLGDQLVRSCLDLARVQGVQSLYLLTETAADYFPRFGFKPIPREAVDPAVKESVEYTVTCSDDAQVMILKL